MIALIRKDLRLSLDVVRPVAIIFLALLVLTPLIPFVVPRSFLGATTAASELLIIVAYAAILLMPWVGLWVACVQTVGDERHGAGVLSRLLPISATRQTVLRLCVATFVVMAIACAAPLIAFSAARVVGLFEPRFTSGPTFRELGAAIAMALLLGGAGLLAGWGAAGLGRPLIAALTGGLLGAAAILVASVGCARLLVDDRYHFALSAASTTQFVALSTTILALFVAGTLRHLGVARRTAVTWTIVLALVALLSGPAFMFFGFVRPAWRGGMSAYSVKFVADQNAWYFVDRLSEPETGYNARAASAALNAKIRLMRPEERISFYAAISEEIAASTVWSARTEDRLRTFDQRHYPVPDPAIYQLAALLDRPLPQSTTLKILQQLRYSLVLPAEVIAPLERLAATTDDPVIATRARALIELLPGRTGITYPMTPDATSPASAR